MTSGECRKRVDMCDGDFYDWHWYETDISIRESVAVYGQLRYDDCPQGDTNGARMHALAHCTTCIPVS